MKTIMLLLLLLIPVSDSYCRGGGFGGGRGYGRSSNWHKHSPYRGPYYFPKEEIKKFPVEIDGFQATLIVIAFFSILGFILNLSLDESLKYLKEEIEEDAIIIRKRIKDQKRKTPEIRREF